MISFSGSTNMVARKQIGSDIVLISMIWALLIPPMSGIVDYNITLLHDYYMMKHTHSPVDIAYIFQIHTF